MWGCNSIVLFPIFNYEDEDNEQNNDNADDFKDSQNEEEDAVSPHIPREYRQGM